MAYRSTVKVAGLSASLILSSRQQKQYRRFELQTAGGYLPARKLGALPTAEEYARFQAWCQSNDSGYFSDTPFGNIISTGPPVTSASEESARLARLCSHVLHPAQWPQDPKMAVDRCPICVVGMHTSYMTLLMRAFENAGGMVEQRWEAATAENPILEAVYAGKIALIRAIGHVEELAIAEKNWNRQHPEVDLDRETKTAEEALRIYWASVENFASESSCSSSVTSSSSRRNKNPERTIHFDETTHFERGRHQHYFWRKSPRYEAGGKYDVAWSLDDSEDENEAKEVGSKRIEARAPLRLACVGWSFNVVGEREDSAVDLVGEADESDEKKKGEGEVDESTSDDYDSEDMDSDDEDYEEITEDMAFIEFGY
ncbi:hypothetical protein P280DRAFT_180289 [Massarina eburnea CBS 473.64]|uniref:Uncharacterized protein n=1 Tax=Massarina eburnea CBS 473.64 TaxID=1395130 RepID=A0A6A6SAB8_9PLEO|nr:hypothetical protein P280DRAFT_180289 [Massarina eburnea CBS 473.64]